MTRISKNPKFERDWLNIKGIMNFQIFKFYNEMYVTFPCKCRNSKINIFFGITLITLKLWIFTNFNMVFSVVLLVFDFEKFLEGVINPH
jgi:hypothetical protein